MQQGFGVQRWKNGAIYFGQWQNNREHGHGTHYLPNQRDIESSENAAKMLTSSFSLFIGEFKNGNPTHGVLLEGEDVLQITPDDITLVTNIEHILTKNVPFGPCHAYRVLFDGRSAFWQRPTPLTKTGEFEAKVEICRFETRGLKKKFLRSEKIQDVWYPLRLEPDNKTTSKDKDDNELSLPMINDKEDAEDDDTAVAARQTAEYESRQILTEKLYKTFRFRGACVCNKSGIFPCPTKGTLYDEDQIFNVEYDGKSHLSDWPTPIRISGKYECHLPNLMPRKFHSIHSCDRPQISRNWPLCICLVLASCELK
jgi:hypothetical protein